MAINTSIFAIFLSFLLYSSSSSSSSAAVDSILFNCGALSNQTSQDRRAWQADSLSNYIPSNANQISEPSMADYPNPSLTDIIPYITARIIYSEFTFTFSNLSIGSKFLRLYFCNSTYPTKNNKTDIPFFSVKANQYTLLSNFAPILNLPQQDKENRLPFLIKEYIIHIKEQNQELNLTFLPNKNSFSFVNGIELVSIPDKYYHPGDHAQIQRVDTNNNKFYYLKNATALETMYRLNVGGAFDIAPSDDAGMMFRKWTTDDEYIHEGMTAADNDAHVKYTSSAPEYSAPKLVYTSARFLNDQYSLFYNLTWFFPVDSGHFYLLRLYFCEFFFSIKQFNDRVFSIYINNMTAEKNADVIGWGGYEPKVAVFRDYVVYVQDIDGQKRKQDLRLSMHPSLERDPVFANILLNGLEIFKLTSQSLNSLAAPNQLFVQTSEHEVQVPKKKKKRKIPCEVIVGVVCGVSSLVMIILSSMIILST